MRAPFVILCLYLTVPCVRSAKAQTVDAAEWFRQNMYEVKSAEVRSINGQPVKPHRWFEWGSRGFGEYRAVQTQVHRDETIRLEILLTHDLKDRYRNVERSPNTPTDAHAMVATFQEQIQIRHARESLALSTGVAYDAQHPPAQNDTKASDFSSGFDAARVLDCDRPFCVTAVETKAWKPNEDTPAGIVVALRGSFTLEPAETVEPPKQFKMTFVVFFSIEGSGFEDDKAFSSLSISDGKGRNLTPFIASFHSSPDSLRIDRRRRERYEELKRQHDREFPNGEIWNMRIFALPDSFPPREPKKTDVKRD